MSWLDFVPTIPEVFDWTLCRLVGHDWDEETSTCKNCGAYRG